MKLERFRIMNMEQLLSRRLFEDAPGHYAAAQDKFPSNRASVL